MTTSGLGIAGRVLAIISSLLVPVFLLLPFLNSGGFINKDYSGWQLFSGADIIVTLAALAVIALATVSFVTADSPAFGAVVLALGAFVLGHMLPEEISPARAIGVGAWLVNVAALGIIAGGGLMLLESLSPRRPAQTP
jgi:hypothetical protein